MLAKITREPALIVGVVTSGLGLAVLFGLELTKDQISGVVVFLGALMALVRFLTTPASEVVVQVKPGGEVVAGEAAVVKTGAELGLSGNTVPAVRVKPELVDERGTSAVDFLAMIGAVFFGVVLAAMFLGADLTVR